MVFVRSKRRQPGIGRTDGGRRKIEMFNLLVKLGFKEIEIGFPAASQIEFDFLRQLVDRKLIPDDVVVQILCQCREHLIKRSFEAIKGIKKMYNAYL